MYTRIKSLFAIKGYSLFVVCILLVGIGVSITMPYLSLYCTENIGMKTGAFGVLISVSSLGGVVANSLIAKRSDSGMDRKWLIITAMLSSAIGYASYLMFHNFFILLITVTVFNGLGAAAMPQIYAYARESAHASQSDDKTFAISLLRTLFSLGFVVGPLGATFILGVFGYKGLFVGTSCIFLTTAFLIFLFLQKRIVIQSNTKQNLSANNASLKKRQIWQPLIAFIFLSALNAINGIITPLFIVNDLHGTHTDVGLVVSVCAGLEIPIMLVLGAIGRKISNHSLLMMGCLVAVIYYAILSMATDSWQLIASQLLQAAFVAIVMGNGLSYFSDLLPHSPGVASTLYANGFTIGRLVGNLGGGMVAELVGLRDVYWVCLVIAPFTFLILWKTRPKKEVKVTPENTRSV